MITEEDEMTAIWFKYCIPFSARSYSKILRRVIILEVCDTRLIIQAKFLLSVPQDMSY